jgi:hypothetical protein
MRFSRLPWIFVLLPLGVAFAQTPSDDNRSLGDVARETREQVRAQNATPPSARVREL